MSGVDNLRGIDYQISYVLFRVLIQIRDNESDTLGFKFEGHDDDGEDFSIRLLNGETEFIQVKKRDEGYVWYPSGIKGIIGRFLPPSRGSSYTFVTNGPASIEVRSLKNGLSELDSLSDDQISPFCPDGVSLDELRSFLKKFQIQTRVFTSPYDTDPGFELRKQITDMISFAPFGVSASPDDTYKRLWMLVFKLSREMRSVDLRDFILELKNCGLDIHRNRWRNQISRLGIVGRSEELKAINKIFERQKIVLIHGLNGIGKSSCATLLYDDLLSKKSNCCWVSVPLYPSVGEISQIIQEFLDYHQHTQLAYELRKSEVSDFPIRLRKILSSVDFTIFFDGAEHLDSSTKASLRKALIDDKGADLKAHVILTSTGQPEWISDANIRSGVIHDYPLNGLNFSEMKNALGDSRQRLSEEALFSIHGKIAGHPMAVTFLKQTLEGGADISANEIVELGIQDTYRYLFQKVVSQLEEGDRNFLFSVSVFDTPFSLTEASLVNRSDISPQYFLWRLIPKSILSRIDEYYVVHDSIRPLVYGMLSGNRRLEIHTILAKHYEQILNDAVANNEGMPYSIIEKWGRNIEKLEPSYRSERFNQLIQLSEHDLAILWGVHYSGWPFIFEGDNIANISTSLDRLVKDGLAEYAVGREESRTPGARLMRLKGFSALDTALLIHLSHTRTYAGHMGYIEEYRFNIAHHYQKGTICGWEHVIEFQPTIPPPRSEARLHQEWVREQFRLGNYDDKPPEIRALLKRLADEVIPDGDDEDIDPVEAGVCPIFGHICPGGKEQADYCRAEQDHADPAE